MSIDFLASTYLRPADRRHLHQRERNSTCTRRRADLAPGGPVPALRGTKSDGRTIYGFTNLIIGVSLLAVHLDSITDTNGNQTRLLFGRLTNSGNVLITDIVDPVGRTVTPR